MYEFKYDGKPYLFKLMLVFKSYKKTRIIYVFHGFQSNDGCTSFAHKIILLWGLKSNEINIKLIYPP